MHFCCRGQRPCDLSGAVLQIKFRRSKTKSLAYFYSKQTLQDLELSGTPRGALLEDNGRWLGGASLLRVRTVQHFFHRPRPQRREMLHAESTIFVGAHLCCRELR